MNFAALLFIALACLLAEFAHAEERAALVKQSNAPISNLLQIRFQDSYAPVFQGADGQGNTFSIAAVVPVRRLNIFPTTQIALLTVPAAVTVPGGLTGFGDLRLLDLVVLAEWSDLVLGVGPTFVFPSASEPVTGQGKWQLGPAVGVAWAPKDFLFGVLAQNPISFAGDTNRAATNALFLQPFATYQFGEGWFLRTEPQMIFNWETHKQLLPVNLGLGRVFKIGPQYVNCFIEPAWNIATDGPAPRYAITFALSLLYPYIYDE